MQATVQQPAEDAITDSSTTCADAAPKLVKLFGYLAGADSDDAVQLRESVAGETGRWLVLRRADIVAQLSDEDDSRLAPGQSLVQVSPSATVVFRAAVTASRLEEVAAATLPEGGDLEVAANVRDGEPVPEGPEREINRWPRRRP